MQKSSLGDLAIYWGTFLGVMIGILLSLFYASSNNVTDEPESEIKLVLLALIFALASARYFLRQQLEPYLESLSNQRRLLTFDQALLVLVLNTAIVTGYCIVISMISMNFPSALIFVFFIQAWAALLILIITGYLRVVRPRSTPVLKAGLFVFIGDIAYAIFASMILGLYLNGLQIQSVKLVFLTFVFAILAFVFVFEFMTAYTASLKRAIKATAFALSRQQQQVREVKSNS